MHVVRYHITSKRSQLMFMIYCILLVSCIITIIWRSLYVIYVQVLFADVIVVDTGKREFLLRWIDLVPNSFVTQMVVVPGGYIQHCRQALHSWHHRRYYDVDKW